MGGGKLVVITGASSGIGAECARWFHKQGNSVLCLARRLDKMKELLKDLGDKRIMFKTVDVTNIDTFRSAVKAAEEKYGGVDCLVNNAGVMLLGTMKDQSIAEWSKMITVNIAGVLNGCKVITAGMQERKSGTVINISSIAGKKLFDNVCCFIAVWHCVCNAIHRISIFGQAFHALRT